MNERIDNGSGEFIIEERRNKERRNKEKGIENKERIDIGEKK